MYLLGHLAYIYEDVNYPFEDNLYILKLP